MQQYIIMLFSRHSVVGDLDVLVDALERCGYVALVDPFGNLYFRHLNDAGLVISK